MKVALVWLCRWDGCCERESLLGKKELGNVLVFVWHGSI